MFEHTEAGSLRQATIQTKVPGEKQMDVYDQHRQAVVEWHAACKEFAIAQTRREQARSQLEKLHQCLAEALGAAMQDPTVPQTAGMPSNGAAIGGIRSL